MDTNTFNEYLEKRYQGQMDFYSKASARTQKKYKNFQWTLIILSTLTTIMAALPRDQFDLHYAVVVSAAVVTIITSALKTFQYQELWVNYRATNEQLKPEIYYYHFNVGDYGKEGADKASIFIKHVEAILSKEHDGWPVTKKLRESDEKQAQPNAENIKKPEE